MVTPREKGGAELTETLRKLYYYAEKMWMDFDIIGVNIDKNKHFSAIQKTVIEGLRQTDDSDDMVDKLRETVEHSKNVEEFLAQLQAQDAKEHKNVNT